MANQLTTCRIGEDVLAGFEVKIWKSKETTAVSGLIDGSQRREKLICGQYLRLGFAELALTRVEVVCLYLKAKFGPKIYQNDRGW